MLVGRQCVTWQQEMLTNWRKRILATPFLFLSLVGRMGFAQWLEEEEEEQKIKNRKTTKPWEWYAKTAARKRRKVSIIPNFAKEGKTLFDDVGSLSYKDASVS